MTDREFNKLLARHMDKAQQKHPDFVPELDCRSISVVSSCLDMARRSYEHRPTAYSALCEEVEEIFEAAARGLPPRVIQSECLDAVALLRRIINKLDEESNNENPINR